MGYVGNLYRGRGVELVVELARALPEVAFELVGGSEADLARWRAAGLPANLELHGLPSGGWALAALRRLAKAPSLIGLVAISDAPRPPQPGADAGGVYRAAAAPRRPRQLVDREVGRHAIERVVGQAAGGGLLGSLADQRDLVAEPGERRAHLHDLHARGAPRRHVRKRQVQDAHAAA